MQSLLIAVLMDILSRSKGSPPSVYHQHFQGRYIPMGTLPHVYLSKFLKRNVAVFLPAWIIWNGLANQGFNLPR